MQKWEYRIFASHLDPVELVIILNDSGKEAWELVTVVAITDHQPLDLIVPKEEVKPEEAGEVVPLEAFRYSNRSIPDNACKASDACPYCSKDSVLPGGLNIISVPNMPQPSVHCMPYFLTDFSPLNALLTERARVR